MFAQDWQTDLGSFWNPHGRTVSEELLMEGVSLVGFGVLLHL